MSTPPAVKRWWVTNFRGAAGAAAALSPPLSPLGASSARTAAVETNRVKRMASVALRMHRISLMVSQIRLERAKVSTVSQLARRRDSLRIWEIVLHMTAWQRGVFRRLSGAEPQAPEDGDWPEPAPPDQEAWDTARAELSASLEHLATVVSLLSDDDLREIVGTARDRALGSGISPGPRWSPACSSTTPTTPARSPFCAKRCRSESCFAGSSFYTRFHSPEPAACPAPTFGPPPKNEPTSLPLRKKAMATPATVRVSAQSVEPWSSSLGGTSKAPPPKLMPPAPTIAP